MPPNEVTTVSAESINFNWRNPGPDLPLPRGTRHVSGELQKIGDDISNMIENGIIACLIYRGEMAGPQSAKEAEIFRWVIRRNGHQIQIKSKVGSHPDGRLNQNEVFVFIRRKPPLSE